MTPRAPRKRRFSIALLVLTAVFVGLAAPLVFHADRINFNFEPDGVVAASHDQYDIGAPMPVHEFSRTVVKSGKLRQLLPPGREVTGRDARASLQNGTARLALLNAELSIGNQGKIFAATPYARYRTMPPPIVAALRELKFLELNIEQGRISAMLPGGFREQLTNADLTIVGRNQQAISIRGKAVWRGQRVDLEVETGRVLTARSLMPIIFKMKGPNISVSFNGSVRRKGGVKLEGQTKFEISGLKAFASGQFVAWPTLFSTSSASLEGPVSWNEGGIFFNNATVRLDDNEATGALTVKQSKSLPLISGTLAFNKLNLTSVQTKETSDDSTLPQGWWDALTSLWTIPVTRFFDADLRLSANQVSVGKTQLGKAAATVSLREGKLSAQLANLAFDGGSSDGQLTVNFNDILPKALIRGRLKGAPLGDLSSTLLGVRSIDGRADVTFDVQTRGSELSPAFENISGKVQISLVESGVVGLDIGAFLKPLEKDSGKRSGKATSGATAETKLWLGDAVKGTTRVDRLDLNLDIANGRAECTHLDARFGDQVAKMAGRINLKDRKISVRALLFDQPKTDPQDQTKVTRDGLISARHISLGGPWNMPEMRSRDVRGLRSALIEGLKSDAVEATKSRRSSR